MQNKLVVNFLNHIHYVDPKFSDNNLCW